MSRFISNLKGKAASVISTFKVLETADYPNNSGYGGLSCEAYIHTLPNEEYLIESYPFSSSKAESVVVVNHYKKNGDLIKRYFN